MTHPWDAHPPNFSRLIPGFLRPYPSFEGWYFRITDHSKGCSFCVIVATNYGTKESMATLIFCLGGNTHSVHTLTKDAKLTVISSVLHIKEEELEPRGFEWEAPGIGRIIASSKETDIDICVSGYKLKALLSAKVHWDQCDSRKGPEGFLSCLPLPTNWYISSIGSHSVYEFIDNKGAAIKSQGWGHEEKNWGLTFPNGHIWIQAVSDDNNYQLILTGAFYSIKSIIRTPYICGVGYWSPGCHIAMTSVDIGTIFTQIDIDPKMKKVSVTAVNPRYTIVVTGSAPAESFSEPILAPIGKSEWKPACRESFDADIKVEVYAHSVWGIPFFKKLVSMHSFKNAALEFGEDLLHDD